MYPLTVQTFFFSFVVLFISVSHVAGYSRDWDNRPNILLIVVDDLRATGEAYDSTLSFLKVPQIDKLAKESQVFTNAHVQSPLCGPSRASIFTSRRPDNMKRWQHKYQSDWSAVIKQSDDLFQTMYKNGYYVYGTGKLYHWWGLSKRAFGYSRRYFYTPFLTQWLQCNPNKLHCPRKTSFPARTFTDIRAVRWARNRIHRLERLRWRRSKFRSFHKFHKPWFITVGLYRPHRPYKFPQHYFDRFPIDQIPSPLPNSSHHSIPPEAKFACDYRHFADMGMQMDDQHVPASDHVARYVRQGYAAAASYADHLVGYLVRKLEFLSAKDNTVVILTSDHGYALGEGGNYCKATSFESSTRVPLIVRHPKHPHMHGSRSNATVELLDLYPTIADIAGTRGGGAVALPSRVAGKSLRALIEGSAPVAEAFAFTETARCFDEAYASVDCSPRRYSTKIDAMMYSVRSTQWRYTETWRWDKSSGKVALWNAQDGLLSAELYDHRFSDGYNNTESEYVNIISSGDFVESFHRPVVDLLRAKLWEVYKP